MANENIGEVIMQAAVEAARKAIEAAVPQWLPQTIGNVVERAYEAAKVSAEADFTERVREAMEGEMADFDGLVKQGDLPDFDDFVRHDDFDAKFTEASATAGIIFREEIAECHPDTMEALAQAVVQDETFRVAIETVVDGVLRKYKLIAASPAEEGMDAVRADATTGAPGIACDQCGALESESGHRPGCARAGVAGI